MNMIAVASTSIAAIGYENGQLLIRFHTGKAYLYSGVPAELYHAFINSASKGKFYSRFIKGKFSGHPC